MNRSLMWLGATVLVASLTGCASTSIERKDAASNSMEELRDTMVETRGKIEKTLVSLNGLMTARPDDLRRAYKEYSRDVEDIAEKAATLDEESRNLRQQSDQWLAGWQESQSEVQGAELKALSERRRAQALERIQSIERSLAEAAEAFDPFVASLQDVQMVLGNDLTPSGVDAVADTAVVRAANQNGAAVARALSVTSVDLEVLAQTLTPSSRSDR